MTAPAFRTRAAAPLAAFLVTLAVWHPLLSATFVADDYELFAADAARTAGACLAPLWRPSVTAFFWRPLPNIVHACTGFLAPGDPRLPRAMSLFFSACAAAAVGALVLALGARLAASVLAAAAFAALPAHESVAGWIAAQGDALVAAFLALATAAYLRRRRGGGIGSGIAAAALFLAALLSKEIAYAGALVPAACAALEPNLRGGFRTDLRATAVALGMTLVVASVSVFAIGAHPFDAPNASVRLSAVPYAVAAYVPLSFADAEILARTWLVLRTHPALAVAAAAALLAAAAVLVRLYRSAQPGTKRICRFGLLWFAIFAAPVSTLLMRWYAYVPSVGLVVALAALLADAGRRSPLRRASGVLALTLAVACGARSWQLADREARVTRGSAELFRSLAALDVPANADLVLWTVPDKIDRVNVMKFGVSGAARALVRGTPRDVASPLRAECADGCAIAASRRDDGAFVFAARGARFLPTGYPTRVEPESERIADSSLGVALAIETRVAGDTVRSLAVARYRPHARTVVHAYFNGRRFVVF